MQDQFILALDQGTTSSRAIVFNRSGDIVASAQKEFRQIYPQPGWVEHDAMEIWAGQVGVAAEALARAGIPGSKIAAAGDLDVRAANDAIIRADNTASNVSFMELTRFRRSPNLLNRLFMR